METEEGKGVRDIFLDLSALRQIEDREVELVPPILVSLGNGQVEVGLVSNSEGHGLRLADSGSSHGIGELSNSPTGKHYPQNGEVYIHCSNRESALVLMEQVSRVVSAFTESNSEPPEPSAPREEGEGEGERPKKCNCGGNPSGRGREIVCSNPECGFIVVRPSRRQSILRWNRMVEFRSRLNNQ